MRKEGVCRGFMMKKSARKFLMFILAATFILQPAWKVRAEEEALPDNTAQEGTIEDSGAQEELTEEEKQAAEEEFREQCEDIMSSVR